MWLAQSTKGQSCGDTEGGSQQSSRGGDPRSQEEGLDSTKRPGDYREALSRGDV